MSDHPARRTALLVGLLCAATLARAGCSVPEHAASDIREVVVQHGGYEISAAKCELLNRQNCAWPSPARLRCCRMCRSAGRRCA